mmetsp:Transcript_24564/g.48066  ORF Transcript_24564/g.48066 Transcript_24564/m.48066 type:complete len:161 (-) Transcript_24564:147-629(-)
MERWDLEGQRTKQDSMFLRGGMVEEGAMIEMDSVIVEVGTPLERPSPQPKENKMGGLARKRKIEHSRNSGFKPSTRPSSRPRHPFASNATQQRDFRSDTRIIEGRPHARSSRITTSRNSPDTYEPSEITETQRNLGPKRIIHRSDKEILRIIDSHFRHRS